MQRKTTVLLVLVLSLVMLPLGASAASKKSGSLTENVTGTFTNAAGEGTFQGQLTINRFVAQGGQLAAVGTLTGTLTDASGAVLGNVTDQAVTLPVDRSSLTATCDILNLAVGPLDLDLLGLVVHLDRVALDVTAEAGSGNLLGNLLCGLSKLLDSSANLTAIANKLNNVLESLG
jgi:hypothetical protein